MTDAVAERRALRTACSRRRCCTRRSTAGAGGPWECGGATSGSTPATARRLFPQGDDSLLAWLDDWVDRRMVEALADLEIERLPMRRRIALLVRSRLEFLTAHREAIRRAVAAHGMPGNVAGTGRAIWRTAD